MIKDTCNRADQARMRKLGLEGYTLDEISKGMKISLACVTRNMVGHMVGEEKASDEVKLVKVPLLAEAPVVPDPVVPDPELTPQQKAAATRKANAAAKAKDNNTDPEFLE